MSRSKKDGRAGGGHVDKLNTEIWSRRCRKVSMWTKASNKHRHHPSYKEITHRAERREGRRRARGD